MYEFGGNRVEIYNFCENRGIYAICINDSEGMDASEPTCSHLSLSTWDGTRFPFVL